MLWRDSAASETSIRALAHVGGPTFDRDRVKLPSRVGPPEIAVAYGILTKVLTHTTISDRYFWCVSTLTRQQLDSRTRSGGANDAPEGA